MYNAQDLAKMERRYAAVKNSGDDSLLVNFRVLANACLDSWICSSVLTLSTLVEEGTHMAFIPLDKPVGLVHIAIGIDWRTDGTGDVDTTAYLVCRACTTQIEKLNSSTQITISVPPNLRQLLLDHYTPFTSYRPTSV